MSLLGQLLHETYRIERLLGRGGTGEVYLALDGKPVGQTPMWLAVTAGVHQLEARRPGYRAVTRRVTLCAKRENKVILDIAR